MSKLITMAIILVISSPVWAEKIYKWVDENGQIHYSSQKPENQPVETVKIRKGPTVTPQPAEEQASEDGAAVAEELTDEEIEEEAAAEEAARKQLAEADRVNNRKQCELARRNYDALNATTRVTRRDANGQVVRMTDDERVNALKNARLGIQRFCK